MNLTEIEVQVRKENGRKKRIREAAFPLLKPLEIFDFESAPDLDARLIKELSSGEYIKDKQAALESLSGNIEMFSSTIDKSKAVFKLKVSPVIHQAINIENSLEKERINIFSLFLNQLNIRILSLE